MEASLLAKAAVTEREPQATENEREEKEVERCGEGRSAASHPLRLYWLPLKHLQLGRPLGSTHPYPLSEYLKALSQHPAFS